MRRKVTFFKNVEQGRDASYIGTCDGEIVFATEPLVQIIETFSLERVPVDVWLNPSLTNEGFLGGYRAYPELRTDYSTFKPKVAFANGCFKVFVDSQNFCTCLNGLSYRLAKTLKRYGQRISLHKTIDQIDAIFPINEVAFYTNARFNNTFIHDQEMRIINVDQRYEIIPLKRSGRKTDLDAPIIDRIYQFADEPNGQDLLVLTGDGDYSYAIQAFLRKNPGRLAACVAISLTTSPELFELANLDNFDLLQLGSYANFFDPCWMPNGFRHN